MMRAPKATASIALIMYQITDINSSPSGNQTRSLSVKNSGSINKLWDLAPGGSPVRRGERPIRSHSNYPQESPHAAA